MNVLELAQKKVELRKASATGGGEWQGPCPGCGGDDRFHVWPEKRQGQGSYWCRGCGKSGDGIQFLIDFEGMNFKEACRYLDISTPDHPSQLGPSQPPANKQPEYTPAEHKPPEDPWRAKAEAFVSWAHEQLAHNTEALDMLAARGINRAAAEKYRLGWNPGEKGNDIFRPRAAWGLKEIKKENGRPRALWIPRGLVIPAIIDGAVVRIRIRRPDSDPRYYVVPGSSMHTMHLEPSRRAAVVIETELDAIAVVEAQVLAGAVAVGTSHGKPDSTTFKRLQSCIQILLALDFDKAGVNGMKWWKKNFERSDPWPVPVGKDPGEAYQKGTDLEKWVCAGLPPALTIDAAAISGPEPERETLLIDAAKPEKTTASEPAEPLAPTVGELYELLRNNPAVVIINTPGRLTAVRNGKYVGGRISDLVFRDEEVLDYIGRHPAARITADNFYL